MNNHYNQLLDVYKDIYLLNSLGGILYWDLNTGRVPKAGLEYRTQQFNWIKRETHKRKTSETMKKLLLLCEKDETLDSLERRNVLLLRREYDNNTVLPESLVGKLAVQSNKTLEIWKEAKAKNKFINVISDLEELFKLNIQKA